MMYEGENEPIVRKQALKEPLSETDLEKILREKWYYVGQRIKLPGRIPETYARVTGFGLRYLQRGGGRDHKKAGVYVDYTAIHAITESGAKEIFYPLIYGPAVRDAAYSELCRTAEMLQHAEVRLSDLPETPFWVGDAVELPLDRSSCGSGGPVYVVRSIDYSGMRGRLPHPVYQLQLCHMNYTIDAHEKDIVLHKRGDIWKLGHGEPLSFGTVEEEAKFYQSLGMSQKLPFEETSAGRGDIWPFGVAIQEIREGRADEFKMKNDKTLEVVLIKYDNEEFGRRMRKHTLETLKKVGLGADTSPRGGSVHMME